jgi:glutamine synthetase
MGQEMKVLEEDVEKSLQQEESKLNAEEHIYPDDVQKAVQELKSKHGVSRSPIIAHRFNDLLDTCQLEVEQLRKRISEIEMKNARVVHDVRCLVSCN